MYEGMIAENFYMEGHGGDMIETYMARPLGEGPFPGVVVIHHMPGWDEATKEMVRKFAHNRYISICPNLHHREKPGTNEEIMKNRVSFHPKEHEQLKEISKTGMTDIFRKFDQRPGQFSWWDFRTRGFERGEGMRIDYILANSILTSSCRTCIIDLSARKQDRPSDHAPVIGEFNL